VTDQQLMDLWIIQRNKLRELFDRDGRLPWGMNCIVWHGAPDHAEIMRGEAGNGAALRADVSREPTNLDKGNCADMCIAEQASGGTGMVDIVFSYPINNIAFWDDGLWDELVQREKVEVAEK
jgi:hypothetical protein